MDEQSAFNDPDVRDTFRITSYMRYEASSVGQVGICAAPSMPKITLEDGINAKSSYAVTILPKNTYLHLHILYTSQDEEALSVSSLVVIAKTRGERGRVGSNSCDHADSPL